MKRAIAAGLVLLLAMGALPAASTEVSAQSETVITMNRLYNPNSGEHFYTASENEKNTLVGYGWKDEGTGWYAPETSSKPVYRLYNPNAGDHHYTMSEYERDSLKKAGWKYEGIGWYSDEKETIPVYRQYNPNAVTGSHNYTISKLENDALKLLGWNAEGIGWYGCTRNWSIDDEDFTLPTIPDKPETPAEPEQPSDPTEPTDPGGTETPEQPAEPEQPDPEPEPEPEPVLTPDQVHAQTYDYDFFVIPETVYSKTSVPVFIKTADTFDFVTGHGTNEESGEDYSLYFNLTSETGKIYRSTTNMTRWVNAGANNLYTSEDGEQTYMSATGKVDGGYLILCQFSEPGTYEVNLELYNNYFNSTVVASKTIVVEDYDAAKDEWMDSVIELNTTEDMDSFEKMEAVSRYLLRTFKYLKNDGTNLVFLLEDEGVPYFELKEWDSYVSPAALCEFAEKIGGFDEIHNCYWDYPRGSDEWKSTHYLCRVSIGDDIRYYQACPLSTTNIVKEYERFDYSKY